MEYKEIVEKVNALVREVLGLGDGTELKPETTLGVDLGTDELDDIEIVMALEEEFNLTLDDDAITHESTLADVYKKVQECIKP